MGRTHNAGGILDLFISRRTDPPLITDVMDVGLSDHRLVRLEVEFNPSKPVYKTKMIRALQRFHFNLFEEDLKSSILKHEFARNVISTSGPVEVYNCTLTAIVNKYAPFSIKTCAVRNLIPG